MRLRSGLRTRLGNIVLSHLSDKNKYVAKASMLRKERTASVPGLAAERAGTRRSTRVRAGVSRKTTGIARSSHASNAWPAMPPNWITSRGEYASNCAGE